LIWMTPDLSSLHLVFMQYNQDSEGNLTPLRTRTLTPAWGWNGWRKSQGVPNNYETDLIFQLSKQQLR